MNYFRILVCGGRDYGVTPLTADYPDPEDYAKAAAFAEFQRSLLTAKLDELTIDEGEVLPRRGTFIIHGGAKGADSWADDWAVINWCPCTAFKADWNTHGRKAGPIRNAQMLDEGKPDLVLAFPTGGRGTANMIALARIAGLPVIEVQACKD